MAKARHGKPVETGAGRDTYSQRYDARGDLGRSGAGDASQYSAQDPAASVRQENRGQPAERGDRHPLAARNKDIFAKLHGAAGDADNDQGLYNSLIGAAELMAVDDRNRKDQLDLLLERVQGLAGECPDREHGAKPGGD